MHLLVFLQGLGSISFFASRAFLPAFVTSLLIRLGPSVPWLRRAGLLDYLPNQGVPSWFASDAALAALGVLAVLEFGAQRSATLREWFDSLQGFLKSAMATLTYLGIVNATDQATGAQLFKQAGTIDYFPAMLVAGGTFAACQARNALLRPFLEADEDDHLGLQMLLRWGGELWSIAGPLVLIVFPLLTIAALAVAIAALVLVERRVARIEDRSLVPCPSCKEPIHGSASYCPACLAEIAEPRRVTLLGTAGTKPARESDHAFRLVAVKRCPVCATRFPRRGVKQDCPACTHALMSDPSFAKDYLAWLDRRVPLTCLVCFCLGLVPILGVIPGVIYYRLVIVAPLSRYIPLTHGMLVRWGVRAAMVLLVALQWIPVAGGLALPSMAMIHYSANRLAYRRLAVS